MHGINPTQPQRSSVTMPDTAAGRLASSYLSAFNGGHTTLALWLDEHGAGERALGQHLIWETTRGFEPLVVEHAHDTEIVLLGRAPLAGDWLRLIARVANGGASTRVTHAMAPAGVAEPPLADGQAAAVLAEHVNRLAAADAFSGAVLLAKDGAPFFEDAWGMASLRYGVPNRADTRFNLGSMNKMFTGVAVAQLVERGLLRFEDTVAERFPDYTGPGADRITIHQLLTHTSGLGDYFNARYEQRKASLRAVGDFLPLFQDDPLRFEPGARVAYSNAGMLLAGAIIERVTGQDYFSYVREHVYDVAGMPDTDAYAMDEPVPNLAIGYTHIDERNRFRAGPRRSNLFLHVVKGGPAGGGFSTVRDLLAFDRALRGHRLLRAETTATVLTGKAVTERGAEARYAYGFVEQVAAGERIVGHSGGFAGINGRLDICLDSGYTVAVLANYDPPAAEQVAGVARDLLLRVRPRA